MANKKNVPTTLPHLYVDEIVDILEEICVIFVRFQKIGIVCKYIYESISYYKVGVLHAL